MVLNHDCAVSSREIVHVVHTPVVTPVIKAGDVFEVLHPIVDVLMYSALDRLERSGKHRQMHCRGGRLGSLKHPLLARSGGSFCSGWFR